MGAAEVGLGWGTDHHGEQLLWNREWLLDLLVSVANQGQTVVVSPNLPFLCAPVAPRMGGSCISPISVAISHYHCNCPQALSVFANSKDPRPYRFILFSKIAPPLECFPGNCITSSPVSYSGSLGVILDSSFLLTSYIQLAKSRISASIPSSLTTLLLSWSGPHLLDNCSHQALISLNLIHDITLYHFSAILLEGCSSVTHLIRLSLCW